MVASGTNHLAPQFTMLSLVTVALTAGWLAFAAFVMAGCPDASPPRDLALGPEAQGRPAAEPRLPGRPDVPPVWHDDQAGRLVEARSLLPRLRNRRDAVGCQRRPGRPQAVPSRRGELTMC